MKLNISSILLLLVMPVLVPAQPNASLKKMGTQTNNAKPKSKNKEKKMFNKNIVELALENNFFRKELVTGKHSQVVLMSINVDDEIGMETHKVDQTLIFVQGQGQAILNGQVSDIFEGHLVFVPAGTQHNFKNTGDVQLKLYTIYAPAQHKPGTVQKTKADYE